MFEPPPPPFVPEPQLPRPPDPPSIPAPPDPPRLPNIFASGDPNTPPDAINVRRPTRWGNKFVIGRDGTREEVVRKHAAWVVQQPELMAALWELAGRHLVCCRERPCHAETLLALANAEGVVRPPAPPALPTPPAPPLPQSSYSALTHRLRSYDSETWRFVPGLAAPPMVCGSVAYVDASGVFCGNIFARESAIASLREALSSGKILVGANLAFDLAVAANECPDLLPLIFEALAEARVIDILIVQALDAIAGGYLGIDPHTWETLSNEEGKQTGQYSLWNVVRLVLGREDAKENSVWKMSYAVLAPFGIKRWPPPARQYTVDDVKNPLEVAIKQLGLGGGNIHRNIDCLPDQVEAAFCFQLGAVRGIRTDAARVAALRQKAQAKRTTMMTRYKALGFVREDGSEHQAVVRKAVAKAYGATGVCQRCGGSGKVSLPQQVACRGDKVRGRYQGCLGVGCRCGGSGQVEVAGTPKTCWMSDGGCDGTGFDVRTAPTLHTITTPSGLISLARDTLSESGDEDLHDYGESEHDKVLDTYLPFLEQGIHKPINLKPNPVLETLRASYSGVIQLIPTKGGVRECFVARDGWDFCSVDYAALELCTVSQICLWALGYSRQAEIINATRDPGMLHTGFGARMIGISVEEMKALIKAKDSRAKNTRQAAKVGNFSFWGGAGAATTVLTNRARAKGTTKAPDGFEYDGVRFCILLDGADRCGEKKVMAWGSGEHQHTIPPTCLRCLRVVQDVLRPAWYAEWPESKPYFKWVERTAGTGDNKRGVLQCFGRKFWQFSRESGFRRLSPAPIDVVVTRGGVKFTDAANGGFQTLAALGAKYALCKVTREAYLDRDSPMFGMRPIFFAHDEIFSEVLRVKSAKAAPRKAQVMREAMREFVPDVFIGADPALMGFWSKDADTVYNANGDLVRWEPIGS